MPESQLGLNFDPTPNYPEAYGFWMQFEPQWDKFPPVEQRLIETLFHEIGEWEHNTSESVPCCKEELAAVSIFARCVIETFCGQP